MIIYAQKTVHECTENCAWWHSNLL